MQEEERWRRKRRAEPYVRRALGKEGNVVER
jgi:hypothetical protein